MPTLSEIFDKRKILLYQNESLDLDHYYQEPYQDENDEIKDMGKLFETDESKKIRPLDLSNEDRTYSGFSYFMDGSRRTYKIGDMFWKERKYFRLLWHRLERVVQSVIVNESCTRMVLFNARTCFCSAIK